MNQPWEEISPSQYQTPSQEPVPFTQSMPNSWQSQPLNPSPMESYVAYESTITHQKKLLSSIVCKVAIGLLFLCLSVQLLALGLESLSTGLAHAYGISEGIQMVLTSFVPCILGDLLGLWLLCSLLRINWKRLFQPAPKQATGLCTSGTFAALSCSFCAVFAVSAMTIAFDLAGYMLVLPELAMPKDSLTASILYAGYVCLLGPILEELLFRGVVLSAFAPFHKGFAVVGSALLFGVFHGNPFQVFTGFFVGLLLGFLTVECKSIFPAMIAHIFNNTFVSITEFIPSDNELIVPIWTGIYAIMAVIAAIVFLVLYHKRIGSFSRRFAAKDSVLRFGQCMGRMLLQPIMILYWIAFIILCILFFSYSLVPGSMFG